ncbi:MAG: type II secretion system F family protein [Armatimonadetes bacterium]|nr:type II secretion system F family protein [Armatimonadota bacterium]
MLSISNWRKTERGKGDAGVSNAELAVFCRQFASLMHAKVNILDIFRALKEQTDNPYLRQIIDTVREDVEMGRSLAAALSRYPDVFSPFFISMVRQGEQEGELDVILGDLANHYETAGQGTGPTRATDSATMAWQGAIDALQALFMWLTFLVGLCLLAAGLTWYATSLQELPGDILPNVLLAAAAVMIIGGLVLMARRRW